MALKIWLPMHDGALTNQGLSNVAVTNNGATVDNNGKIGKCYSFDGLSKYISITNPLTDASEVSCAVWVKPSTNTSTNEQIMNIGTSSGWANIRFGILQRSVNQFVFHVSDGTNTITYSCVSVTIAVDEWIHVACVYKNRELKMYLNGELVKTYSISFDPSFTGITNIGVGAAPNGAEKFTGYISDFRLYDNALSPQEVKRLAQGLVLHYPLSGIGGENLLSNAKNNWGKYSCSSGVYGGSNSRFAPYQITIPISPSTKYICHITDYLKLGQAFYVGVHQLSSDLTFLNDSGWKTTPYSFTALSNAAYARLTFRDALNNDTNIQTYLDNIGEKILIKFEKGEKMTPWSPNLSDPEYHTMGLDDGIEHDTSGFQHNGTKTGTITWDSNSARYNSCYAMTGTTYINCGKPYEAIPDGSEEFTLNIWAYKDTWDTSTQLCSCTENGGFSLSTGNNSVTCYCHVYRDSSVLTNSSGVTITNSSGSPILLSTSSLYIAFTQSYTLSTGWHMFTMVYTKQGLKLYVDGNLARNSESSSIGLHYNLNCNLFIGAEATGFGGCSSPYLNGKASDFRIFAKALDADAILNLYRLGGSLDSNGVFHTYEYVE